MQYYEIRVQRTLRARAKPPRSTEKCGENGGIAALFRSQADCGSWRLPLGGFVLGPIGDKHGRKAALVLSVLLMGGATTLIGLLPTCGGVGVLAPVALRCVQGIAAGGEWSGSAAYLVENAPDWRRGLYAEAPPKRRCALGYSLGLLVAGPGPLVAACASGARR